MYDAFINFFQMLLDEFISPITKAITDTLSGELYDYSNTIATFFNWLLNIGRDQPINYFSETYPANYFFNDIIETILIIISIFLFVKLIKIIFKPIFKLFNIGGDVKWRR